MLEFVILIIFFLVVGLCIRISYLKCRCRDLERNMEKLKNREFWIPIETVDVSKPLEERFQFISTDNILIHNTDKRFYESLEKDRAAYEKIVVDAQKFKEMLRSGMTINQIKSVEEYKHTGLVCFDLSVAIMGKEIDGVIHLTNGRHRCMIAKELGLEVPIYISSRWITCKIGDCI